MSGTVEKLKEATRGTKYEGRLFLVGGYPRDRLLGLPVSDDVDIVLEGDSQELARFLWKRGLSDHRPVTYPRFGTAMIALDGHDVELVSARAESYDPAHRKPEVRPATLKDDVYRRDFTINTLLQNLHTDEVLDLTGRAREDLAAGIIRTPLEPRITFHDDPLRMLRAIRFAVRFGFSIAPETWTAIQEEAHRLNLMGPGKPVVSAERIRDELVKTFSICDFQFPIADRQVQTEYGELKIENPTVRALRLLLDSNLLVQFWPELVQMLGVTQNAWHLYDVWEHTLAALACLSPSTSLELKLALLFHDAGKPRTRSEDERGIHFYEHQRVGAEMTREALRRLKLTTEQIRDVSNMVALHMRPGEYRPEWTDAAVKRLIRDTAPYLDDLLELARCDQAAMRRDVPHADLEALRRRVEALGQESVVAIQSPLDGAEIMAALAVPPGPIIREAKEFLTDEVIEGRLDSDDKEAAREALRRWWEERRRE